MNQPGSSKAKQMPLGRRRSSNGYMVILRTPTTLVRSKVSNTPSKALARYSYSVLFGRRDGKTSSCVVDCRSISPGVSPDPGYCAVFMGKTLY